MPFVPNAAEVARSAMLQVAPNLVRPYVELIIFLSKNQDMAKGSKGRKAPTIGSDDYIAQQARKFAEARYPRAPSPPKTVPDELASEILVAYYGVSVEDIPRMKREHLLSMSAENIVGDLLERYLASVLEPNGWVWCSGATITAVDFIKPPVEPEGAWTQLQVKNRSNSENSSSKSVRVGTGIKKWHRTVASSGRTLWTKFPAPESVSSLSEAAFRAFFTNYLDSLRREII